MNTELLRAETVKKSFQLDGERVEILRGVSLTLDPGETLALTGDSGSGKSTLLHLLAGLDLVDSGHIQIEGQDISTLPDTGRAALRRGTIGLVFQQFNLIPSLNVANNIAFQARLSERSDTAFNTDLIERLGLSDHVTKFPEQLSGGQQQRVAIARTLAARPSLILADEPTGNLDEASGHAVLELLLDLVSQQGCGLITVTHSSTVAGAMSRRLHLRNGVLAA